MECPNCNMSFGIELDNLDIHLKDKTKNQIIEILHSNWKLQEEFSKVHKGSIKDLEHELKYIKTQLSNTRLDLVRCENKLKTS